MSTSIEEYLDDIEYDPEAPETITMDGDDDAIKALRRLGSLRKRIEANQAIAQAETDKINEWEQEVNGPLRRQAAFFEGILEGWAVQQRQTAERKTINLPAGVIKTMPKQDQWVIDPEKFADWAAKNEMKHLVKVELKPKATDIKKAFKASGDGKAINPDNGEVIEGITLESPANPYNITIKTK